MNATSRQDWLVSRAREQGFARVSDLAEELGVSGMTIRRDLDELEARGLVTRVRGGVVPGHGSPIPDPTAGAEADGFQIGILIPDVGIYPGASTQRVQQPPDVRYYFDQVLAGARAELERAGIRPRLMFSLPPAKGGAGGTPAQIQAQEERAVAGLLEGGISGLLFSPNAGVEQTAHYVEWLRGLPIPVVLMEREIVDQTIAPTISSVRTAHEVGVRLAVEHLREHGHERIYVLRHLDSPTAALIHRGWLDTATELGLDPHLTSSITDWKDWPSEAAVDRFAAHLRKAGVTALLAHNDNNTFVLLQRLREAGVRVPEDLSVISYDDSFAEMFDPPVTAVAPPRLYVGRLAARLLADRLEDPASSASHVRVEPSLSVRSSVTAPA